MFISAQRAFGIKPDRHFRLLHAAAEGKPKVIVLSVVIQEAEGLEAKDANGKLSSPVLFYETLKRIFISTGFSDPYCMLGIMPIIPSGYQAPPLSPLPTSSSRILPETIGMDSLSTLESPDGKMRKHNSFRLSFKKKSHHRDASPMPAKIIKATSVKPHTLCPKWNEKFKLYNVEYSKGYKKVT
jgi:BAI1-associated protein 3